MLQSIDLQNETPLLNKLHRTWVNISLIKRQLNAADLSSSI